MFYFIFKIIVYLIILLFTFYLFNKREMTILEIIILLFIFNICLFSLYNKLDLFITIIISLIIILIYYLYCYLYNQSLNKKIYSSDKVLINRGIINFKELIKENLSYDSLIYSLKKKGIANPNLVDYCIKRNNDLIIFRKNSIKNYPISIIVDGIVLNDNLYSINKTKEWLDRKLNDNNLELSDINYAYYKKQELYFITN